MNINETVRRAETIELRSRCDYKLSGTNNWEISVKSLNCDQWATCKKNLSITFGGFRVIAVGTSVTVNNVQLNATEGYVNGRK